MHHNRGKTLARCLKERTDYAQNPEKTAKGELVTAYECDPMTCDAEFLLAKRQYEHNTGRRQKSDVIAYQIRQSFKPGEVTPEEANEIGRELALRFTKGKHAFIVATHTDRAHIHNHVIFNSTSLDCTKKFRNFHLSWLALSRLSDQICMEHRLSVITPKPYSEREKYAGWPDQPSFRAQICAAVDAALEQKPQDFAALVQLLRAAGYEYKPGKQPALRGPGQKRFIRFRSLGEDYSVEELTAVLEGRAVHQPGKAAGKRTGTKSGQQLSFLIDIQQKIQEGKGAGYVQWAKVFNLKQTAQAMLFMEEKGIQSPAELAEKAAAAAAQCDSLLDSVRADEQRLQEIAALRKHIINYSKAKETFAEYRASGYSQEYFENHRELLTLRRAAKQAFDEYKKEHGSDAPLPKKKQLDAAYSETLERKKKNYAEYRRLRSEMQDWQVANRIVQTILEGEQVSARSEPEKTEHHMDR